MNKNFTPWKCTACNAAVPDWKAKCPKCGNFGKERRP